MGSVRSWVSSSMSSSRAVRMTTSAPAQVRGIHLARAVGGGSTTPGNRRQCTGCHENPVRGRRPCRRSRPSPRVRSVETTRQHSNVVCLWLVPMRTESVARTNETEGRRASGGSGHLADAPCLTSSVCPGRSRSCRIRAGRAGGASRRRSARRQRRTAPRSTSDARHCR